MSIICDFCCKDGSVNRPEILFTGKRERHICEECISLANQLIAERKLTQQTGEGRDV